MLKPNPWLMLAALTIVWGQYWGALVTPSGIHLHNPYAKYIVNEKGNTGKRRRVFPFACLCTLWGCRVSKDYHKRVCPIGWGHSNKQHLDCNPGCGLMPPTIIRSLGLRPAYAGRSDRNNAYIHCLCNNHTLSIH